MLYLCAMQKDITILSPVFHSFLDEIEKSERAFFITGKAGTGKSTLLKTFVSTTKKKCVVLAPTGIAALNVHGQTIHSFFQFAPKPMKPADMKPPRLKKIFKELQLIIIDEVSMVRADLLDQIDQYLRRFGPKPGELFGGVQIVFFGDLFQLPPVVPSLEEQELFRTRYQTPFFFSADCMKYLDMQMLELHEVYRQTDRRFLRLLESVRLNQCEYDEMEELNSRYDPAFVEDPEEGYVTLSARNATVNEINTSRLNAIKSEPEIYLAKVIGDFNSSVCPTELSLTLKVGAQVMFLKNDTERRYVNGTIGQITKLNQLNVEVTFKDVKGNIQCLIVEPTSWESYKYAINKEGHLVQESVGSFIQLPLRLAWAITIHKSQGQTFEKCIVDMGKGAFEFGQTYVALSRCRTFGGLVLRKPLTARDILCDDRVVEYYELNR